MLSVWALDQERGEPSSYTMSHERRWCFIATIESAATVGIPSSIGSSGKPRSGIVLHYPGSPVLALGPHTTCRQQVRNWHNQHVRQGWAGLGYHYLICHHGIVLTGRGLNRQGAHAPGANATHIGVQFMLANTAQPTTAQLQAFREFRTWLSARGVNSNNITPHSRWVSTSCPGDALRSRISSNNWGTGGGSSSKPGGSRPAYWTVGDQRVPSGATLLSQGSSGALVTNLQECLNTWRTGLLSVDGDFGPATKKAVETFQRAFAGVGVDGAYGQESADKMREVITALKAVSEGVLGMTENRTFNDQTSEQVLPRAEWTEVRWEDGKYSLAFSEETFQASIALRVSGLEKGDELQYRFTQVQPNPDTPPPSYTRARHLGIDSPVHDGGQLHVTGSYGGVVPKSRRIRVEAIHYSDSEDVKITGRSASVLYSK